MPKNSRFVLKCSKVHWRKSGKKLNEWIRNLKWDEKGLRESDWKGQQRRSKICITGAPKYPEPVEQG